MTIDTLCYINNLLTENESKANYKRKWVWETLADASDKFEIGAISKVEYETIQEQYEIAKAEHNAAKDALDDWKRRSW